MVNTFRTMGMASVALLCVTGCGTSPIPVVDPAPLGSGKVIFHVKDMCERLGLH